MEDADNFGICRMQVISKITSHSKQDQLTRKIFKLRQRIWKADDLYALGKSHQWKNLLAEVVGTAVVVADDAIVIATFIELVRE